MRNKFVVLRSQQVGAYFFESHQEAGKVGVAVQGFCFRKRRGVAVALAEFEQGGGLDRFLEKPMELRLGKLANKSAGRRSYKRSHHSDCRCPRGDLRKGTILCLLR